MMTHDTGGFTFTSWSSKRNIFIQKVESTLQKLAWLCMKAIDAMYPQTFFRYIGRIINNGLLN
jgi:hypothetical protein